jgi:UDP-N-acetylglucosamine 4-epimerase
MDRHIKFSAILTNKKFLVTGGAGFIGSHITEFLLNNGAEKVRVLDNLSTGFIKNIEPFFHHPSFEFVEGDIRDYQTCLHAMQGIQFVSHQAALGSVPRSIEDPITVNAVNISGFLNVLAAAQKSGVTRMVYASSSSVYGDSRYLPKIESNIGAPLSPYAVTKQVNEKYAEVFSSVHQFHTIGLRYFNVFGLRQNPNGEYAAVIPRFIKAVAENKAPIIYGDGKTSRDFTFVDLAVQANLKAMLLEKLSHHEALNIAAGKTTTLTELAKMIITKSNSDIFPIYLDERTGDIKHSLADVSKAKSLIGYLPNISLKEGLDLMLDT